MKNIEELRRYARGHETLVNHKLLAIADAIEQEVEQEVEAACAEAYGNGVQSVALPDMSAYAKLPVDADGVPIHVGDVMEWPDCSTAEVVGIGDGTFFYVEDGEDAAEWSCASDKIHHHAPTVEDVLREFAQMYIACNDKGTIAEYAAKLRLAGDE